MSDDTVEDLFADLEARFGLGHYILADDGITPVRSRDLLAWARWMEAGGRHVAQDLDEGHDGRPETKIRVSTVFLGIDHRHAGDGPPILWETMVFGGVLDGEQARYTSHAAALAGHQAICARVMETITR